MEIVKKNKKSKKRRHHSADSKKKYISDLTKILDEENMIIKNLELRDSKHEIHKKKNKLVQTEIPNICENLQKMGLLLEKDEQIKSLTERLQQVTNKLYESKNAYISLKQDFNKAQKLLCSEVGDNVSVAGLSNQSKGWRGRAEQIQQLQQKITELQAKISNDDGPRRKSLERRSSCTRNCDKEIKQQIENLSQELKDTESALENSKKKFEVAKARIAVLENEFNNSKRTIVLLNEKTIHDNQLIEALHDKMKISRTKYEDRVADIKRENSKLEKEIFLIKGELEGSQIQMRKLEQEIEEKNKEIEDIKSRNEVKENESSELKEANRLKEMSMLSPRSCVRDANEYIAIGIAAEAERDRLLELVTVLNQRLDKERFEYEQLSESYKKERNRGAKLEAKLQKLELERMVFSKVNIGSYRLKASKSSLTSNSSFDDPEDIRLKFELLQEECLTLKTRLVTIEKDKASDFATFKKLLDHTRKVFKDACRGKLPTFESNSSVTL